MHDLDTFNTKGCQILCFPHTTNICTGHVVSSLSSSPIDRELNEDHVVSIGQMYKQALACDPIPMAQAVIQAIQVTELIGKHLQL